MKKRFYLPGLVLGCLMLLSTVSKANTSVPVISSDIHSETVCTGSTVNFALTASDTASTADTISYHWQISTNGGISWSALTTGAPYTVSGNSLTIVTTTTISGNEFRCIATDSAGSDTSAVATLTVDAPTWGTISGPSAVCTGTHITLVPSIPGGVWTASNDFATVSSLGVVTGDSVGNDTLIYYVTNTCGTGSDTTIITINASPDAGVITGPSVVCKNSTISLSESLTGGVWSRLYPTIDSISATGIVGGLSQGIDTIKYTTTTGLCASSAVHVVRVDTFATAQPITGPSTTCVGLSIHLMDANVLGNTVWTASNAHADVSTTGYVTGVSGGTVVITDSFTNACNTVVSTTTVGIDTLLSPGLISGSSNVCAGSWIHLSETLATGIWMSSNSMLAIVDGSGNVTGVNVGTPVISYVVSNGCGAVAATKTVTVSIPASSVSGPDSVGVAATIALTDSAFGGTWSIDDTTIAHISSTGIVTGESYGTTTATYTVNDICGITTATKTIMVGPAPSVSVIDGPDSVCKGFTITLTDTIAGGTWSGGPDSIATINSTTGVVTGVGNGEAVFSYTVSNGFGTTTNEKSVFVNEAPKVTINGPSIIALGGNYFLLGYPATGTWTSSNTSMGIFVSYGILTDTNIVINGGGVSSDSLKNISLAYGSFVVTSPGSDTLTYTVTNTCGTTRVSFPITLAAVNDHTPMVTASSEHLNVYPNPNNGEFNISLLSANTEDVAVTVTNIIGEKVQELNISTNKNFDIRLDQPSGIYIVTAITADGNRYNAKINVVK